MNDDHRGRVHPHHQLPRTTDDVVEALPVEAGLPFDPAQFSGTGRGARNAARRAGRRRRERQIESRRRNRS
jgi:hypothetical protein